MVVRRQRPSNVETTLAGSSGRLARSRIVLLGTGTPVADPERSGPSVAIIADETPYIVDSGPGVVRRAAAALQAGIESLAPQLLRRAFLTHLHSDHTTGLPDLILSSWVSGRGGPLEIYGPTGTHAMIEHLLAAYRQDIDERLHGLEPANEQGWQVSSQEVAPGIVYKDTNVIVEAFPVKHGSLEAFGYKFLTPDRAIVISGDTAPTESIVEKSRKSDVLIHEVYSEKGFTTLSSEWQKYHSSVHTSSQELAEIATRARPKLLILYHQLLWRSSEQDILLEIRKGYDGPVVSGQDLEVY